MKIVFFLAILNFFSLVGVASGASPIQLLIFGKTTRPAHAPIIPLAGIELVNAFAKNGIKAVFIQDADVLNQTKLEDFQAILLLDVSEAVLGGTAKKAIEKFVEDGGGLLAVHASIAAGKDWPWFQDLVGTTFVDHPPIQPAIIRVVEPTHAANELLPLAWSQSDEWYNFSSQVSAPARVLLALEESSFTGGKMGSSHPISWSRERGKGKFWYTAMGHPLSLYEDKDGIFVKMILQATLWASASSHSNFR